MSFDITTEWNSRSCTAQVPGSNHSYYGSPFEDEFPLGNYLLNYYDAFPSICALEGFYNLKVIQLFQEKYQATKIYASTRLDAGVELPVSAVYMLEVANRPVFVKAVFSRKEIMHYEYEVIYRIPRSIVSKVELEIFYTGKGLDKDFLNELSKLRIDDKEKSKIHLVVQNPSGFTTKPQIISSMKDMNLTLNYGDKFKRVHDKIVESLNTDMGKGLVLLHGEPGTGKTSYIRYLAGLLKKNVIFLPPDMAGSIADPRFVPFLLNNTNSILIIEDAERVVMDREGSGGDRQGVANILNLTDGLLSDCLSIQIIATFNTQRERIDKALLRKGRLIAEWKFDALSLEDSNKLLKSLGKQYTATAPMTLTDIYNIDEESFVSQQERKPIGFVNR